MSFSEPVKLLPKRLLLGNPTKTTPKISPDGTRMAYLAPLHNVMNVWVETIGQEESQPITSDATGGIWSYFWAADNIHLLYLQDQGGDQNWHLYAINLQTRGVRDLTPFDGVQVRLLSCLPSFPDDILVTMNKENPSLRDVYRLHLPSGTLELHTRNPGNIIAFRVDTQLQVRGGVVTLPDGGFSLVVRETEHQEWRTAVTWGLDDAFSSTVLEFAPGDQSLYLQDSRYADTARLVRLNLPTGACEVLAEDPEYDMESVLLHPRTHALQAVALQREHVEWIAFESAIARDLEQLRALGQGDVFIASRDSADATWIVGFTTDTAPVSYYLYDRSSQKATFLFDHQADLRQYDLSPMKPMTLSARDGLLLHGYLTLPPGREKQQVPMVLYPHGGPWWRDRWGYNPDVQWLANRGYACLQINFRGSTGYGKAFLNAGDKEWGAKMHDDLVDAVHWAIQQGIADPQRIAIYGGSYGGYAALVGAAFTPDLFCCAVAFCPVSNLVTFLSNLPPYAFPAPYYARVGHPETEKDVLESRSPLFKAEHIKIPLLLAHGANDPGVKPMESEQILDVLKRRNIACEYLLFPDEGHGFVKPENRMRLYETVERFFAHYLGGCYEP